MFQVLKLAMVCFSFLPASSTVVDPWCHNKNGSLQSYNREEQGCCDGEVFDKKATDGTKLECCDRKGLNMTQLYDKNTKLCCGPYLVDRIDSEGSGERFCCKGQNETQFPGEVYEEGKTCCNGKVYNGEQHGCCGAVSFDHDDAICCETDNGNVKLHPRLHGVDQRCCGLNIYNASSHYCYEDVNPPRAEPSNIQYHMGKWYDTHTQVPCYDEEGTILNKPSDQDVRYPIKYECCDMKLINADLFDCCSAIKGQNIIEHKKRKEDICCGNTTASSREKCCNRIPNKYSEEAAKEGHQCCGTDLITKKYECCNGKKLEPEYGCCGGKEAYDKNKPQSCCGDEVINTNQQVCCSLGSVKKYPISKARPDHNDCCARTNTSFNKFTESCPTTRIGPKQCPYCDSTLSISVCKKKFAYVIYINSIDYKKKSTLIKGFISPRGNVTIRIPYHCYDCIKQNEKIVVYTNRSVKHGLLRLSATDMINKFDRIDEYGCDISKKVVRLLRKMMRSKTGQNQKRRKTRRNRLKKSRKSQVLS